MSKRLSAGWLFGSAIAALFAGPACGQTLPDAIAAAFATNPALDIQRAEADVARAGLDLARSQGRPRVNLSASGGYESIETNAPFAFNVGEQATASAQIQAVQPLYTGGRIRAGIEQARAGIDAADLAFLAAQQDLILDVVTAYVDVRRDRESVRIRQNNVEVSGEQVRAASDRFNVGVVTRTDVAQSQARLEGARAALAGAEAALEASEAFFEFLTGTPAPAELAPPPPLPPLPASLEAAIQRAISNNPEIAAAREQLRAASAGIEAARAEGRPSLSVIGTAGVQERFGDRDQRDTSLSAVAQGRIPLFTGGAVKAQVDAARLRRDQARRRIDLLETQSRATVSSAWFRYAAAQRSIEASRRQIEAAELAYEGAKQELAVGVRTTLDVLDQEQQLFEARLALVNAERDAYVAAHQLLRATGDLAAPQG